MFQLVFNAEGPVIKIAVTMKGAELTSEESYSLPYALEPEYLSAWRGRASDGPVSTDTHTCFGPFLHLRGVRTMKTLSTCKQMKRNLAALDSRRAGESR